MCGYIILNSEGVGEASYTILSADNLKKILNNYIIIHFHWERRTVVTEFSKLRNIVWFILH